MQQWAIDQLDVVYTNVVPESSDPMMWISCNSQQLDDAFAVCEYMIHRLQLYTPFWLKTSYKNGNNHCVEAETCDCHRTRTQVQH